MTKDETQNQALSDPATRMAALLHEFDRRDTQTTVKKNKKMPQIVSKRAPHEDPTLHKPGQHKGINVSIEMSDAFIFDSAEIMTQAMKEQLPANPNADVQYIYSRGKNPTVEQLARYLASMEHTESAYCTSSGMSAITAVMMHLCQSGDHVVAAETIYAGTVYLFEHFLKEKCKIDVTFVDITDVKSVKKAIHSNTKVLYFDSVANPALIVADIPVLSQIAHDINDQIKVVVDNTFAPMIISPVKHNADIVIHSLTKYACGGGDIMGGVICGTKALIDEMTRIDQAALTMTGAVMSPRDAFELIGRLAHLNLRVKEQSHRALQLAQRIKDQLKLKVIYPGMSKHEDHAILNSIFNEGYGYGGVFCIDMKTKERAFLLLDALQELKFGFLAGSLGYYETLLYCPGAVGGEKSRTLKTKRAHMADGYIRISIGYVGNLEDKWELFKKAYTMMRLRLHGVKPKL